VKRIVKCPRYGEGDIVEYIIKEVEDFYKVIKLKEFRKTEGVTFDVMVQSMIPKIDAIDRVIHQKGAISPGTVGSVEKAWYMHTHQEDNLFVLHGERYVELYKPEHGKIERFTITPDYIEHNGERILEGGGLVTWTTHVFHRITSGDHGSASINLATHLQGYDVKTNFNIYDLNVETGDYKLLREGYKDQK
jgi:hypothetical protein